MRQRFCDFWKHATDITDGGPLPYQESLATKDSLPSLVDVPTGLGKTAAAILAWIWRRRFASESIRCITPRRLVYCLPMRVLVEQTYTESLRWITRLGMLAGEASWGALGNDGLPNRQSKLLRENGKPSSYEPLPDAKLAGGWGGDNGDVGDHPIAVHLLMGGMDRTDWAIWPEWDAILIGTQDMLLSRALNRGYAAGRARWPLEFGVLNNDCLWVYDELQLMGTGLATSLQLDAWRRQLRLRSSSGSLPQSSTKTVASPCHSLWMSATMSEHWLRSAVDWTQLDQSAHAWENRCRLGQHQLESRSQVDDFSNDHVKGLLANKKSLHKTAVAKLDKPKGKSGKIEIGRAHV